jgi:hypothetical protein
MPPEVAARAFDPFFTTKGVGKGTGLGLSQVFGFARQSGGHVRIDTEQGRGTRVSLYLPAYHGGSTRPRTPPCRCRARAAGRSGDGGRGRGARARLIRSRRCASSATGRLRPDGIEALR